MAARTSVFLLLHPHGSKCLGSLDHYKEIEPWNLCRNQRKGFQMVWALISHIWILSTIGLQSLPPHHPFCKFSREPTWHLHAPRCPVNTVIFRCAYRFKNKGRRWHRGHPCCYLKIEIRLPLVQCNDLLYHITSQWLRQPIISQHSSQMWRRVPQGCR